MPWTRAALIVSIALIAGWGGVSPAAQKTATDRSGDTVLTPGRILERTIAAGLTHRYTIPLRRGDFLHVRIAQRGVDLEATLTGPDGADLLTFDAADDDFRPEIVVATAPRDGDYRLSIRPVQSKSIAGRYVLTVDEPRPATAHDEAHIAAERAFQRGHASTRPLGRADYARGIEELLDALAGYRAFGDRGGELRALITIATSQSRLGRPEGLATAREAERLARAQADANEVAAAVHAVAFALDRAGDTEAAHRTYDDARALSRAGGNRKAEMMALLNQGVRYGRDGAGEQAVACFEEALSLSRATGYASVQWGIYNNLGIAYKNLGEHERALESYRAALSLMGDRKEGRPLALNNMGNLERMLGNSARALELHLDALAIAQQIGAREHEARSLNTIGQTYYRLGEFARALEYHRRSLEIRRQIPDLVGEAASLNGVGRALHRLGQLDGAVEALEQALALRRQMREQLGEMDTLGDLAAAERDRGNLAVALDRARAAVQADEAVRQRITSPALRASFSASGQDTHAVLIEILQRLHGVQPDRGYDAQALYAAERARARVLLESALDARIDLRAGIEPELLDRARALQARLESASTRLSRALATNAPADRVEEQARPVDDLTRAYEHLQAEIRQRSPRYAAVTQPQPLTVVEIQRELLDDDTVLIEFALGEDRSWAWAVTRDSLRSVELPARAVIDTAARSLHERLTARRTVSGESSAGRSRRIARADGALAEEMSALGRMLFTDLAPALLGEWRGKRLAIVAAGALEYVPFAALPLPGPALAPTGRPSRARPLLASHEIVTVPSASVLAVLRRETAERPRGSRTLAIIADPVFEPDDPRVRPRALRPTPSPVRTAAPTPPAVRAGLARLPFSREEAETIAALVPPHDRLMALDFRASRDVALHGGLADYRIVHFATHGLIDSARPPLSSLVLSLVDDRGAPQNGYLRLHDIYNLRLGADLVVLSACQTALGREMRGEGLVGLTRAFMYAGTSRVVASLWEVNDLATADLMKKFYAGMLQQGLSPAAALRAAQLQVSRDPRWTAPYYWAGFTLQGDWR